MIGSLQAGLVGSGALFVPTDLGSLGALYEGPGIVHSGASASAWNDSSGSARHLVTGGGGTYVANAGAGLPGIAFAGTYFHSGPSITNRSFFAVFSVPAGNATIACMCGAGRIYGGLTAANMMGVYASIFVGSGQTYSITTRHSIAVIQRAANDMDFWLDGVKVNITTGTSLYPDTPLTMACESAGNQLMYLTMEHMSICTTALSSVDVAKMLGYINRVYGV